MSGRRTTGPDLIRLRRLADAGASMAEAARATGISEQVIRYHARRSFIYFRRRFTVSPAAWAAIQRLHETMRSIAP
jgi:hypothetical protein